MVSFVSKGFKRFLKKRKNVKILIVSKYCDGICVEWGFERFLKSTSESKSLILKLFKGV